MEVGIRSAVFSFLSWEDDELEEEPESHSSFPSHNPLDVFDQMCVCVCVCVCVFLRRKKYI